MVYHSATLLETSALFERSIITEVRKMSQKLSDTILEFKGDDARTVLQGQTTRNFVEAASGSVVEGAFCDLKGRVIADFCAVIVRDDYILMRTKTEIAAHLTSHLKKYLMFSKTTLSASNMSVWACKTGALDEENSASGKAVRVKRPGNFTEVWAQDDFVPNDVAPADSYNTHRLLHGDARIVGTTIGKYLPQDLNYDLNGRIDFDKGCYTGQEIIARLHYRGEPKRRLRLLSLPIQSTIPAGEKVVNSEGKSVGSVIEAAVSEGVTLCLCEAVLDIENQAPSILGQAAAVSALQLF